ARQNLEAEARRVACEVRADHGQRIGLGAVGAAGAPDPQGTLFAAALGVEGGQGGCGEKIEMVALAEEFRLVGGERVDQRVLILRQPTVAEQPAAVGGDVAEAAAAHVSPHAALEEGLLRGRHPDAGMGVDERRQAPEVAVVERPSFAAMPVDHGWPGMASISPALNSFGRSRTMTKSPRSRPIALMQAERQPPPMVGGGCRPWASSCATSKT